MMVFHVERLYKALVNKGFFLLLLVSLLTGCAAPRPTVAIDDYTLLRGGKKVLGREDGLTAFFFENNKRKIPFAQFLANKYKLDNFVDVEYWVTVEGHRMKVMLYDNADVEKYFDTSAFMVTSVEPESTIVGSRNDFLAVSVISSYNEDCLADGSLYQNITINYLKQLKQEYNSD